MHLDVKTLQELVDISVRALLTLTPVVIALGPIVKMALPGLINAAVRAIPDKRMASATAIVTHAGLIASGQITTAVYKLVAQAQDPNSPGGKTVTPDEWSNIIAKFKAVGWQAVLDQGAPAVDNVLAVYGGGKAGEEAARAGIDAKVVGDAMKALARCGLEVPPVSAPKAPAPQP
jgi:hypothetical protein